MLYEELADIESTTPEGLRARYERELAAVLSSVGVEAAASETSIEQERLEALAGGEPVSITVSEAAAVLGLSESWPDGDTILAEVRDHLLLQMSSAVLDVDALASGLNGDLDARDIQQKIEGRQPMTLAEYARINHYVARNVEW